MLKPWEEELQLAVAAVARPEVAWVGKAGMPTRMAGAWHSEVPEAVVTRRGQVGGVAETLSFPAMA